MTTKEKIQEDQYVFPYHHLTHETSNSFYIFRHLFWGLEHYTYIHFVIDQVSKLTYGTLLDIGCGEGRIITELEKINNHNQYTGVDLSKKALTFAQGFTKQSTFFTHDITISPLKNSFDVVISCEVIEHIHPEKIPAFIENIAQTLHKGGYFILTTPTTNVPTNKKHYQHFTVDILEKYLDNFFTIEDVVYLNKNNFLSKILNRLLANRFYLSNINWLNKCILLLYKKYILFGDKNTGSRIYIKAKRR